ncbi:alpha-galactosidase [Flavitalea flava]
MFKIIFLFTFNMFLFFSNLFALPSASVLINTLHTTLLLKTGSDQKLYQAYFGSRLTNTLEYDHLPLFLEAYTTSGMNNLFEPAIRVIHGDGNPSLDLRYTATIQEQPEPNFTLTTIQLKDPVYPFFVTLHFKSYYKEDIIEAWTEIRNEEKKPVRLSAYASFMLHVDAASYWLTQFHGDWFSEMRMEESRLTSGIKILDSKLGTKTNNYQSQAFLLALNKAATENEGEVIAGTLAWTGNFRYAFETDNNNTLNLSAGINPFASEFALPPGSSFTTPAFIFTYSLHGKGEASRNIQRWAINYGILNGKGKRETLLNNWEATFFDFDENKLSHLIKDAAGSGLDMFLLDDGWFGNKYPRKNDGSSLGDWQVTKTKLPHGIGNLVKEAADKGIKFGIWIEPEMVNPKSELYEKHPDWMLRLPNREEDLSRNQLVLDLNHPAVRDFIYNTLDSLLIQSPGLAYIKWDCNRYLTNAYSSYLGQDQSRLFIGYTLGWYSVLKRFRAKYPTLPMMLCSSGGGRVDYGALHYFSEFWPSDNTDAFDRIFIQWGYSYFFPSLAICSHVTSSGKYSLKFKTDVAMSGKLGYDIVMDALNDQEKEYTRDAIRNYKRLSGVIWHGDLYRLVSPYEGGHAVIMHVDSSKNNAVIFSYNLHTPHFGHTNNTRLEGLDTVKMYRVKETDLYPGTKSGYDFHEKLFSGDYLMKIGLNILRNEALSSNIIELIAENQP